MSIILLGRILALLMLINELVIVICTPHEDRQRLIFPRFSWVLIFIWLIPFFLNLKLPEQLMILAITLQVIGLFIEVFAEIQLGLAHSFGILFDKGTRPQTTGFYYILEHPIYIGILLQLIGWSIFMPVVFIVVGASFLVLQKMVQNERKYLADTLGFYHKGLDSKLWSLIKVSSRKQ